MNTYKITRLEKIKEDNIIKRVVIGITASNGKKSVYTDWTTDIKNIGTTKEELSSYIKGYMAEIVNQADIDEATEEQEDDPTIVIPEPQTRTQSLDKQLNTPVITQEADNNLVPEEVSL